jgi:hypothetical protein
VVLVVEYGIVGWRMIIVLCQNEGSKVMWGSSRNGKVDGDGLSVLGPVKSCVW